MQGQGFPALFKAFWFHDLQWHHTPQAGGLVPYAIANITEQINANVGYTGIYGQSQVPMPENDTRPNRAFRILTDYTI